jgi:poly [ADP-ribose] polymerase
MVFNRWGRVGVSGQFASFPFQNAKDAISCYEKKYKEKTGKGYTEIKMDFEDEGGKKEEPKSKNKKKKSDKEEKSSLDPRVVVSLFSLSFLLDIAKSHIQHGFDDRRYAKKRV